MNDFPPFAWTPYSGRKISSKISTSNASKKLSVIVWDQRMRATRWLDLAYKCLSLQKRLDDIEIIHLEWESTPNPIVLSHGIAKVYTMGFPNQKDRFPFFDLGLQWNAGLYLANAPWVCFYHCDLIRADQIETILDKIEQNPAVRFFEGYAVNGEGAKPGKKEEMEVLLSKSKGNPTVLPTNYQGSFVTPPYENGFLATFHKDYLIQEHDGFLWNLFDASERWNGLGRRHYPGGWSLRQLLKEEGVARTAQPDMGVYQIFHGHGPRGRGRRPFSNKYSGVKFFSDFERDWLPQHPITLFKG